MAGIEDWLPTFHVGERHQTDVALPAEQALRQALAAPATPDPFVVRRHDLQRRRLRAGKAPCPLH
jgi:hypothetical protein